MARAPLMVARLVEMRFALPRILRAAVFCAGGVGLIPCSRSQNRRDGLVEMRTKRDNMRCIEEAVRVRPEVSPTRVSGQRREAGETTVQRAASQERNIWSAGAADARDAYGFALRAMRDVARVNLRTGWKMSEVRFRTALLPAVYLFRHFEPVRMHTAHPGADCA